MKYIILAAGKGTRLRPKTNNKPKPLVNITNNHSILRSHVHNADQIDYISEIIIVTGYKDEMIRNKINKINTSTETSCVYNPYYDIVGPLGSVWAANNKLSQDNFILCNGDTIFHPIIYENENINESGVNVIVSDTDTIHDDDLKLLYSSNKEFRQVGKNIKGSGIISAGAISVVGKEARKQFTSSLYDLVSVQEYLKNKYWHSILNQIPYTLINFVNTHEDNWIEIDNPQDLARASDLFSMDWVTYD